MTLKRSAVQAALADRGDFVSADELHMLLAGRGVRMGLTAVYRALRQLEAAGVLDVTHVRPGRRLFRMRAAEGRRHYLVCRRCYAGRPVDTEAVEQWARQIAAAHAFTELEHTIELGGVCGDCRSAVGR
ncbi:Fur family transcriptional regulator [Streptomyces zaomyceticus]|uniref:Fur family transcriptional regulator n=1 Tax=Streptomyces zaomyceticus TaxID=68286 RepID=UPI002E1CA108